MPEPSPRPWRAIYARILDARGKTVCVCEKDSMHGRADDETAKADAALIVAAVNERDRLRDIVRRMADLSESLLANYEYRYREDANSMAFVDNTRGFLREARAAIGEDAPASPCAPAPSVVSSSANHENP